MENKILVELIVPQIDKRYSVYIPVNVKIGRVHKYFNKAISEFTNNLYNKIDNRLYDEEGNILDDNCFVSNSKIQSGCLIVML